MVPEHFFFANLVVKKKRSKMAVLNKPLNNPHCSKTLEALFLILQEGHIKPVESAFRGKDLLVPDKFEVFSFFSGEEFLNLFLIF